MSLIHYDLQGHDSFANFVSYPAPGGGWTAAVNPMPARAGIYLICNSSHVRAVPPRPANLYIGIANNLRTRYRSRSESVVHLGLTAGDLAGIEVWYGTVHFWDTRTLRRGGGARWGDPGNLNPPDPRAGRPPRIQRPSAAIGAGTTVRNYSPRLTGTVDGQDFDLEHLLLRFYLRAGAVNFPGGPATNTNTRGAGPAATFTNTARKDIKVLVNSLNNPTFRAILPAGASW